MAKASGRLAFVALAALLGALAAAQASGREGPRPLPDGTVAHGHGAVVEAYLAEPTDRYRHFVLGSHHEAASLVVRLRGGETLRLDLPDDEVFEDREPRLADLDRDGTEEILLVRSSARAGSSLVVVSVGGGRLAITASSPATGAPNRWLNPAGIADFDGDGRLDIAYVQQPHVLGLLRVVSLRDGRLVEIASAAGFSNHRLGSRQMRLSVLADFDRDGVLDLALPSLDRTAVRAISLRGGVRELWSQPVPDPISENLGLATVRGRPAVLVRQPGGRTVTVGRSDRAEGER